MDNYPAGAAIDPIAPYNMPLPKENRLKFELNVKGRFFPNYYSEEELEEKSMTFRKELENLIDKFNYDLDDYTFDDLFVEIW